MTEQVRTEDYRDVLEDLARSRGMSGAEELARRVVEADPDFTERHVLEEGGGVGPVLNAVLDPPLSEEEKMRVVGALVDGPKARKARGLCSVPGCPRPAADDVFGCKEHTRRYDARADEEAWGFAISILQPWVDSARPIGSDELTRVMEGALAEAERELNRALDELEAAEAAL